MIKGSELKSDWIEEVDESEAHEVFIVKMNGRSE